MFTRSRIGMAWLLVAALFVPVGTIDAGKKKVLDDLDRANQRWQGASCRSRVDLTVKKGKNKEGWSKCQWLFWSEKGGNKRVGVQVTNGEALRRGYGGGFIPAGTEFVAVGWAEDKPGGNVRLDLETTVHGTPVGVRVYYYDSWEGKVTAKRINEFERWVRLDLFSIVSTPNERLVEVGSEEPRRASAYGDQPAPAQPADRGAPTAATRDLEVMAVSVEPSRVAPGSEIDLIVVYTVDGVPPGATVMVTERRTILHHGQPLTSDESAIARGVGLHRSRLPMVVPGSLAAGVYELQVAVEMSGISRTSSAVFEVIAGNR